MPRLGAATDAELDHFGGLGLHGSLTCVTSRLLKKDISCSATAGRLTGSLKLN